MSGYASLKDGQHFLQKSSEEANSNISYLRLNSTHGKANSQASRKTKTRTSSKKRYKLHQKIKQQKRIQY